MLLRVTAADIWKLSVPLAYWVNETEILLEMNILQFIFDVEEQANS